MTQRSKKNYLVTPTQMSKAEAQIVERSKRIDFYMTEYSVELLTQKMDRNDFVIPDYQREFTWEPARKSRFIESVLMGLPIPFLFFWEMNDGKLEIVDGSQRLRTLHEYILKELRLSKLTELTCLNDTCFNDLSTSRQRKIQNRSIRGIVLNEHADEQARFDIFERINTGSKQANTTEVRRGALRGPFLDLTIELSQAPLLAKLAPVSQKSRNERIPEELVTRFFAYGDGLDDYKDSPSRFIFDYTKKMNSLFEKDQKLSQSYRKRFMQMLQFVEKAFPTGFTKPSNPKSTPRARFEAIAIGSDHAINSSPRILKKIPDTSGWISGKPFKIITTSDAANVKSKLDNRIKFVKKSLLGEMHE